MTFRSKIAPRVLPFLAPFLLCAFCQSDSQSRAAYSLEEAQKVLRAIDKIEVETQQPWNDPLRAIEVSESEFNSYIAYRIETEQEEIMKELRLKIFKDNVIEGKIHIDLRGQKIPQFIRPEMDIYFAADVITANGMVRLEMKKLFLEDEPIQPYVIDMVIAISARLSGQEATSISDWYELPYGIKEIRTEKGKAFFYY